MTTASDAWTAGDAYEAFMGRWSRPLAREFVAWLAARSAGRWLDVGCGTGALSAALGALAAPASVVACDPSAAFIEHALRTVVDTRVSFVVAAAEALPAHVDALDGAVSGLVLNFLAAPERTVAAMRARVKSGGVVAAYVWDYAGGMELLRAFWDEAVALEPGAEALDEARRFPLCRPAPLATLWQNAGLVDVATAPLTIATELSDFDDFWRPMLGGTGPAPAYVASLDATRRDALRDRLAARLTRLAPAADGRIHLHAKAWAVRGTVP